MCARHRLSALLTSIGIGGSFAALLVAHVIVVFPFALRLTLAPRPEGPLDRDGRGVARRRRLDAVSPRDPAADLARRRQRLGARLHPACRRSDHDRLPARTRTETLPVRMFLYIQDNIDPLVTSVSRA